MLEVRDGLGVFDCLVEVIELVGDVHAQDVVHNQEEKEDNRLSEKMPCASPVELPMIFMF